MPSTLARLGQQLDHPAADGDALQRAIAEALADAETRIPMFCVIAEKVLRHRLAGEDEPAIAQWLVVRVGIAPERTAQILSMTADAGHAAADIGDGADFDDVVDRIAGASLVERPFVAAMVRTALELLESETARLDRLDFVAGLIARFDLEEPTIHAAMDIVCGLLARHDLGATDLAERLARDTGMSEESAGAFVEQSLLARQAALRIRAGEDVPSVFRQLGLERAAPQLVIVTLRLVDDPDLVPEADG